MNRSQLILIGAVGLLLLAAILIWRAVSTPSVLPETVNMVCVETGKMFVMAPQQVEALPASRPDNGRKTLVPCAQRDGRWFVSERRRELLEQLRSQNRFVDENTLEVKSAE